MKLVEPSEEWQDAFLEMAAECRSFGDARYNLALTDFALIFAKSKWGVRRINPPAESQAPNIGLKTLAESSVVCGFVSG